MRVYPAIKRTFDIAASITGLVITLPLSAAAAFVVKTESEGPAVFVHERIGRYEKPVKIYKFRSMKEGSEALEKALTDEELEAYYQEYRLEADPRVTRAGRLLRHTYFDELPQLVNVLQNRMSLVGPRPVTAAELDFYTDDERTLFLSVKPGITGYWQVFGKGRATYQNGMRQQMELYYAEHASLLLDTCILISTPAAVIRGLGKLLKR